jgi:hypothetical protein
VTYNFANSVLRFIGFIANRTKQAYVSKKWKYYSRSFEKISLASGAEWLRDSYGWIIFRAEKLDGKSCVLSLLDYLNIVIDHTPSQIEINTTRLNHLAFLTKNGFPLTENYIKKTISGKPQEGCDYCDRDSKQNECTGCNKNSGE